MATRRKIPVGAGSYFVISPRTLRFPIERAPGDVMAELWCNAGGDGALALVPPGGVIPPGGTARRISPIDAVELLRRANMARLAAGQPEHKIPAALLRRAKAETLPGYESLVAFPGQLKTFYEGRGSWADTGLWVSGRGEFQLEMRSSVGYLRKSLTKREAELWLRANGHELAWEEIGQKKHATPDEPSDPWRIATRGASSAGEPLWWSFSWRTDLLAPAEQQPKPPKPPREQELRAAVRRARSIAPPAISPPRKPRRPRRGK